RALPAIAGQYAHQRKDNTLCCEDEGERPIIPAFHVCSPKSDGYLKLFVIFQIASRALSLCFTHGVIAKPLRGLDCKIITETG
ncbi:hypothetical protein AB9F42_35185, partial [Rhizobium leguminosarum]|uniref:hypothetical protein n=1 Tax=Rhizobium leguminosarum TaxID=384 RepID=UPI003F98EB1F